MAIKVGEKIPDVSLKAADSKGMRDITTAELCSGKRVVLVDDSAAEIAWSVDAGIAREAQVQQQIASRRLLFRSTGTDVTDALVQRMNNDFRMGAGS